MGGRHGPSHRREKEPAGRRPSDPRTVPPMGVVPAAADAQAHPPWSKNGWKRASGSFEGALGGSRPPRQATAPAGAGHGIPPPQLVWEATKGGGGYPPQPGFCTMHFKILYDWWKNHRENPLCNAAITMTAVGKNIYQLCV